MKVSNISLTSAELGSIWASYMQESGSLPLLKYFLQKVEDTDVQPIVNKAVVFSEEHLNDLTSIFKSEGHEVPRGYSKEDVDVDAPKLYSDIFVLHFLKNLGKNGVSANGLSLSSSTREDIRALYLRFLQHSIEIEEETKSMMLSKGIYVRPPVMENKHKLNFIQKEAFLRGWFGERRTLTADEIAHIFMNYQNNVLGKALLTGFAQTAQDKKVKKYLLRGIELATDIVDTLRLLFEESSLPVPMTWDAGITDVTTPVFSDQLMMFLNNSLSAVSLANMGGSLALSMRRDIATKYLNRIKDIALYAEDGFELMINYGWMERPPQVIDRDHLLKK